MSRPDWTTTLVQPDTPLEQVLAAMDSGGWRIALVCDEERHLKGVITDGDVRRALLRHVGLEVPAKAVMNPAPITTSMDTERSQRLRLMLDRSIERLPIVDDEGRVCGIELLRDTLAPPARNNAVVLMAGGFGTRLRPLTQERPKPLLHVGDKPILEHILESFVEHGFRRFYISVHYKAEMIREYFGDGRRWGVEIDYLHEDEPLGTAGCLTLLPDEALQAPVMVMNGDILTRVNFDALLNFHEQEQVAATLCVREYSFQIPFGVVRAEGHRLKSIEEKPVVQQFVSAGIYVLNPEVIRGIDRVPVDVPDVLERLQGQAQP
ncbi:nucleotidyltransferase family protein, partial [Sulfurivirga sp.]|uniref:nucleotidyltransferase family protein n=1 Tax=Sulfurivirga sp. TaxID=2614236 RepID=UPI0025E349B3